MAFTFNNATSNGFTGSAGATFTAGGACAANQVILIALELDNVSSANQTFQPVVTDGVNTGNYQVWGTAFNATGAKLYCWLYMITNASGTPAPALASSANYNNGHWSYVLVKGFANTPVIDPKSAQFNGAASPVNGTITPSDGSQGTGEILLLSAFAGNLSGSPPAPWSQVNNFSGAFISALAEDAVTSTAQVSFSQAQTATAAWWAAILAFNDGSIAGGGGGGGGSGGFRRSMAAVMPYAIKQSTTEAPLLFLLIASSDHITGKTGASPSVSISKAGGAFSSPAGAVTEIGNGWYQVAGNATDTSTLGPLTLHATATGADPTDCVVAEIVAYDPQDGGTIADVASAVWEEALSAHTTAGTGGQVLAAANTVAQAIPFSASGNVKADIKEVNDSLIGGAGTATSPWGPSS